MSLILRSLNINDREAFLEGLNLFSDMDLDWYSFIWNADMTFDLMIKKLEERAKGINIEIGRVPDSMLYAFLDGEIIGRSSIRHELNDHLLKVGGHIGFAVATKFRRQGHASEILKQSLQYCNEKLGLEKVLVTCDDDNWGSIKTIEKFSGALENKVNIKNNVSTRRYWIKLK